MSLANKCYNMQRGILINLPERGGVLDQNPWLMLMLGLSWRAWFVWGYKPENNMKWDEFDTEFMEWVVSDGS